MCPGLAPPEKRRERPPTSSRIYSRRGQLRPVLALGVPLCLSISPWRGQAAHTNTGCLLSGAHEHPLGSHQRAWGNTRRICTVPTGPRNFFAPTTRPRLEMSAVGALFGGNFCRAGEVGSKAHGGRSWSGLELSMRVAVHSGRAWGACPPPFPPVPTRSHIPLSPGKPRHSKRL